MCPPGAIDIYLSLLSIKQIETLATFDMGLAISKDTGYLRRYRADGTAVEVEFANSRILPDST